MEIDFSFTETTLIFGYKIFIVSIWSKAWARAPGWLKYKKAFLNEQCKEIEKNNRTGNTRDNFKKTGDMKGTFHTKMGTIKDRNGKDLTEAKEFKKRWQEYTEELYKKS